MSVPGLTESRHRSGFETEPPDEVSIVGNILPRVAVIVNKYLSLKKTGLGYYDYSVYRYM